MNNDTPAPLEAPRIASGETAVQSLAEQSAEWYALYTRHQHEQAVARHLAQRGFSVFLPLYSEVHRWSDRRRRVSLPLFPCYVFFAGDLERRLQILSTPGVCSLVAGGGRVAAIPAAELDAIRRVLSASLSVQPHPYLHAGDCVRVGSGPLAGIEGVVSRCKDATRIVLSVRTLCRSVSVEVDEALLDRIAS